jgi:hypothetical protein
MWKTAEGSTGRLLQLCLAYFFFYTITGVSLKYFTGPAKLGLPHVGQMEYLVYNTIGGTLLCLVIVLALRWYHLKSQNHIQCAGIKFPVEYLYIIPSGVCTAVIIPTTTLMYLLLRSVMVAMVVMRGSIIVMSRIIDAIQIRQGILKKKVYWAEEFGVVFAILAVSVQLFLVEETGGFDLLHSPAALFTLGSYLVAYFIRLYIMNYYKNTRGQGVPQDNKAFFAVEQIAAFVTMLLCGLFLLCFLRGAGNSLMYQYQQSFSQPSNYWPWEIASGFAYGMVAFFSVFLFMFKGRTATFAGIVNRLTSLVAGTSATLFLYFVFGFEFPKKADWISLVFILAAVGFLTQAEKKRTRELKAAKELA